MIATGYSLHLYCDTDKGHCKLTEHFPSYGAAISVFHGEDKKDCLKQAKKMGWFVDFKKGISYCPACYKSKQ